MFLRDAPAFRIPASAVRAARRCHQLLSTHRVAIIGHTMPSLLLASSEPHTPRPCIVNSRATGTDTCTRFKTGSTWTTATTSENSSAPVCAARKFARAIDTLGRQGLASSRSWLCHQQSLPVLVSASARSALGRNRAFVCLHVDLSARCSFDVQVIVLELSCTCVDLSCCQASCLDLLLFFEFANYLLSSIAQFASLELFRLQLDRR